MSKEEDWEKDDEGDYVFKGEDFMKDRLPFGAKIPKDMLCTSCKKNVATVPFSAGGFFDATHMGVKPICEVCYAEEVVAHWEDLNEANKTWRLQLGRLLVAARSAIPVLPKGGARDRLQEAIDWHEFDEEESEEDVRERFWRQLESSPEFREAYEHAFDDNPDDIVLETKDDITRFIEELRKGRIHE